ncbi:ras-specific guanine nucleotide-releasing factor 1-like [Hippocampus comes]|uniref:ras-specific guanine nucleotide-releasing factor 1-like n=1 Tax=Hippocampus comes TaxID=109280 RepID=UPI00094E5373|nr:PREDICTED: ras-specific guanine nucleotide-releasing factor 1-like [Hippocampus comes]
MFLHQIFYQGLKARIASWPTLVLADLFDILLPMLNIYQEFVRNHQYSLQILAHCKQNRDFDKLLKQYEMKPDCEERTLETFLTYPMFQIPRYILTLHELLAHTPHEHVERNSLDYAKSKLEELSRVMHDEVSETENIRKNLAIERMIVEGCEVLLDTSQTFVRQGRVVLSPLTGMIYLSVHPSTLILYFQPKLWYTLTNNREKVEHFPSLVIKFSNGLMDRYL